MFSLLLMIVRFMHTRETLATHVYAEHRIVEPDVRQYMIQKHVNEAAVTAILLPLRSSTSCSIATTGTHDSRKRPLL